MEKLRRVLGGNDSPDEESGIMSQLNETTTLSWTTRLKGFLFCFILGILLSFLGSFALFLNKGLTVFAVLYTLGNIISIASTCFLMGPFNQFKKMFASTRAIATVIVLVSFTCTLLAALWVFQNTKLTVELFCLNLINYTEIESKKPSTQKRLSYELENMG